MRWLSIAVIGAASPQAPVPSIAVIGAASPQAPVAPPVLQDATAQYGLTSFTQTFSSAFADLDRDGDDDLVVSNHGRGLALYLNDGARFTDRSDLLPKSSNDRHGLTIYDLDGDGDRDIVLANGGGGLDFSLGPGSPSQLFANRLIETGTLSFEDVSAAAGVAFPEWRARWFMPVPAAAVDLYLASQLRPGRPNAYLENMGALRFRRRARGTLTRELASEGKGTVWDFDRDGAPDLLTLENTFVSAWHGAEDGSFRQVSFPELGGNRVNALAAGDLNRDGYPDLYVGGREGRGDAIFFNLPGPRIWRRGEGPPLPGGRHRFTPAASLPHDEWTRSVAMVDLDANGWLDVLVQRGNPVGGPNGSRFVLMSDGDTFTRFDFPPAPSGQGDDLVVGFVDGDRRPDVFVTNGWGLPPTNAGPYELWVNRTPARFGEIIVRLVGAAPNTDALGAQVEVRDARNALLGYRMLAPRGQAQDTSRLHFGLGDAPGPLRVDVRWPDGSRSVLRGARAGSEVTISQR